MSSPYLLCCSVLCCPVLCSVLELFSNAYISMLLSMTGDSQAARESVKSLFLAHPFLTGLMCHVGSQVSTINAVQCNAIQCSALQCNPLQYNALQYNAMQYNAVQCSSSLARSSPFSALLSVTSAIANIPPLHPSFSPVFLLFSPTSFLADISIS